MNLVNYLKPIQSHTNLRIKLLHYNFILHTKAKLYASIVIKGGELDNQVIMKDLLFLYDIKLTFYSIAHHELILSYT